MAALTPREKREIKKREEAIAKEREQARKKAEKKYNKSTTATSRGTGSSPSSRITNIYQTHYGNAVTVTGQGNQVAVGIDGDVAQEIDNQNISTQPIDLDTTLAAVRDLLHHLQHDGIQIDNHELADELRNEATQLQSEAQAEEPDQGTMKRLAANNNALACLA